VLDDFFVGGPLQEAALDVVSSPAFRRHRRRFLATLRDRRDRLAAAATSPARVSTYPPGASTSGSRCPGTSTTSRSPPRPRASASS
jgi:hypothetical protein